MSSANSESLTSFPICIHCLFSFSDFWARTSNTMLSSSGESGHPCLVPDFRGKAFNFLPLKIMFAVLLLYITFIILRYAPFMPIFWRVFFYHKWELDFVKGFLCIYWNTHLVFIFQFINVVCHTDWSVNIESLHPWNKAHLIIYAIWSF